jgi:hypothetical protein
MLDDSRNVMQTAAGFDVPSPQINAGSDSGAPAITFAQPAGHTSFTSRPLNDYELAESIAWLADDRVHDVSPNGKYEIRLDTLSGA